MFKLKSMAVVFLIVVLVAGQAYSLEEKTISGKVVKVDVEGGIVGVETYKGLMVFHLSAESSLFRDADHMSVIELEKGDPVRIQYFTTSTKNNVISLVDGKD